MHELFLKGRRFHEAGSDAYGNVLLLQVSRITSHICISLTVTGRDLQPVPVRPSVETENFYSHSEPQEYLEPSNHAPWIAQELRLST